MENVNILLFVTVLFLFNYSNAEKPVVTTTHGKISGKILNSFMRKVQYYGFMGIPFAKPPVGDLRFLVNIFNYLDMYVNITKPKSCYICE